MSGMLCSSNQITQSQPVFWDAIICPVFDVYSRRFFWLLYHVLAIRRNYLWSVSKVRRFKKIYQSALVPVIVVHHFTLVGEGRKMVGIT